MNTPESRWLVRLEFQRVQTYLFKVPELRAMVGANARIGETLRGRLLPGGRFAARVASDTEASPLPAGVLPTADNLPALAVQCGASLPAGIHPDGELALPTPAERDLLPDDNPRAAYTCGVLVRDGGHLHAVFPDEAGARRFVREARRLVATRLPGLPLSVRYRRLERGPAGWHDTGDHEPAEEPPDEGQALLDLPQLQVCRVTGQGPANSRDKETPVSSAVLARRREAEEFDAGQSHEVLGLLRRQILERLGLGSLPANRVRQVFPSDFSRVAGYSEYLAVIAADGNGIGNRSQKWRRGNGTGGVSFFAQEARGEQFFRRMRAAVRTALVESLATVFGPVAKQVRHEIRIELPLRLMMLGGDDLLLVCDAVFALRFVLEYARELGKVDLGDGHGPLHVGIGVAVVKKKFPFHRSHALAEQLQASAKRLAREQPGGGSTVDWLSISEAWHDEIAEVRQRDAVRRYRLTADGPVETLILSRKPYPVLGNGLSLESLLKGAAEARGMARNQLIGLADAVRHGRRQADWAVDLLPPPVREVLQPALSSCKSITSLILR